jgi:hypothetical protein
VLVLGFIGLAIGFGFMVSASSGRSLLDRSEHAAPAAPGSDPSVAPPALVTGAAALVPAPPIAGDTEARPDPDPIVAPEPSPSISPQVVVPRVSERRSAPPPSERQQATAEPTRVSEPADIVPSDPVEPLMKGPPRDAAPTPPEPGAGDYQRPADYRDPWAEP